MNSLLNCCCRSIYCSEDEVTFCSQVVSLDLRSNLLSGVGVKVREGGTAHERPGEKPHKKEFQKCLKMDRLWLTFCRIRFSLSFLSLCVFSFCFCCFLRGGPLKNKVWRRFIEVTRWFVSLLVHSSLSASKWNLVHIRCRHSRHTFPNILFTLYIGMYSWTYKGIGACMGYQGV